MKKYSKVLIGALALTIVLIVAITGVAAAAGPYNEECPRECGGPNEDGGQYNGNCQGDCDRECDGECDGDCTCDCECQCDGDCQCGCESQSETESLEGDSGTQTKEQACKSNRNQNQLNNQYGGNGNCNSFKNCNNNQYMHGVGNGQ